MKKARVLVVDDERDNVEILRRSLELKGHGSAGAANAEEAVKALADGAFDLVLIDHVLPGTTGMQALPRLKKLTRAPIHVMSGYTDADTRQDAILLGADGFLPKPLDLGAVYALLDALPERPA